MNNQILDPNDTTIKIDPIFFRGECKNIDNTVSGSVYKITNILNGKIYIGITKLKVRRRWHGHKLNSRKSNYPLYRSIRKYGTNKFQIERILSVYANNIDTLLLKLNKLEIIYIKKYNSYIHSLNSNGYNLTIGGGLQNLSIESRTKLSESIKQRYKNDLSLKKRIGDSVHNAYVENPELGKNLSRSFKLRYSKIDAREMTGHSIRQAYINKPELRVKARNSHLQLNKEHPELGIEHSIRISGKNHPRYDCTPYNFRNIYTSETFVGTPFELRKIFNLSQSKISSVMNNKRKHHRGWTVDIIGSVNEEKIKECYRE